MIPKRIEKSKVQRCVFFPITPQFACLNNCLNFFTGIVYLKKQTL